MSDPQAQALQEAAEDLALVRQQLAAIGVLLASVCVTLGDQLAARDRAQKAARAAARKASKAAPAKTA